MRILSYVYVLRLEEGGIVRAALDASEGLAQAGADFTLLTGDGKDAPPAWDAPDGGSLRVEAIDDRLTPWLSPRSQQTAQLIKQEVERADVVHLHNPWAPFNPAVAAAAKAAGKPYVLSVHGMLDDWCMAEKGVKKRVYLAWQARRLMEEAAWIHFTAQAECDQAMRWAPRARPMVAPLLMDLAPYESMPGPELAREAFPDAFAAVGAPRLLFLGRLQAIKGLPTFLSALERYKASGEEPPHLLIAGPPEENHDTELAQQAEAAGLGDRVHLLGMVTGELKKSLYEAADAFVLPSHHENFGIALVEAMLCGLPVITSKCVGIWDEAERFGGIVTEHSVAGFAEGVRSLLAELPERRRAAQSQREAVSHWLDPQRVAQQYLDAYEAAIRGEAPSTR